MNSLSWLIYLGELSSSVAAAFGIFAAVTAASTVFFLLYGASVRDSAYKGSEEHRQGVLLQKKTLKWGAIAFPIFLLVSVVLPSKQTVYMIAASEAGEQALKTPEFGKLRLVINQYLDEKLEPKKDN